LLARLGLAAAALLLVLALAELGMRVLGVGQVMTYDRDTRFGYVMRPSQVISTYGDPIEINALGLRGPPVLEPKPPGIVRVLFLGDSITYGGGRVYEGDLFCRRVEARAREDGFRVEAVNVSAPGWGPQNWTAWVEAHGVLDADVIVMVIPAVDRARPFGELDAYGMVDAKPILRLSTLWLKAKAVRLQSVPLTDEALELNIAALTRLKTFVGARPLLAVFVPSQGEDPRADRWLPFQALFPEALDLRGRFGAQDYFDADHFSAAGHRVIAEGIYERLRVTLAELAVLGDARGGS
jgi:hypothetical protein